MDLEKLTSYELLREEPLEELDAAGYVLRHRKSGARIALIANEDENKVFQIAFRTPPYNNGGLPHILEHSVLCGSKQFPVKDPFVELMKGSLNTFLNAMTGPDKTMYPVASCNDKDFHNLMHVYLDAVFYPKIYEHPEIFYQEGWSCRLESEEDAIEYNGVVYNEMKGVYSTPDEVLTREIQKTLFPDTCYAFDYGGDPEEIPNLTYEEFLAFHKKYYHPSNSYIYLYGAIDYEETLRWMDEAYLSQFDAAEIDAAIALQPGFDAPKESVVFYPVSMEESEEEKTLLSWNVTAGRELDPVEYIAFEVIDYALLEQPGAVLREALLEAGIGTDISGGYYNGIAQPYFSIVARDAGPEQKEEFLSIIKRVLTEVVEHGFDRQSLLAGINGMEFKAREFDFGRYPKGLMFGMTMLDSWTYDEDKPFIHLKTNEVYAYLKEQIWEGYFERLVATYLLDNPHAAFVAAAPKKGLAGEKERAVKELLAVRKASMNDAELKKLVEDTRHLAVYQEEGSTPEALMTIPLLQLSDIKKEVTPITYEVGQLEGVTLVEKDLFTNQISYLNFAFRMEHLPQELLCYAGVLKYLLAYVDTETHSYASLANEINIHSGGLDFDINVYEQSADDFAVTFEGTVKVLDSELPFAFSVMEEVLLHSLFDDARRVHDVLNEMRAHLELQMPNSSTAARRALSYCAKSYEFREQVGGVTFFSWLEELVDHFDEQFDILKEQLAAVCALLFTRENLVLNVTGSKEARKSYKLMARMFVHALPAQAPHAETWQFTPEKKNEGLKTSAQVQYVAQAGSFGGAGYRFHGSMRVLRSILVSDYLWNQIRVKGGAYGLNCMFSRTGYMNVSTYRDPHLKRSKEVFSRVGEYIRNFDCDDREMLKYIIGTVSDLGQPLTPGGLAEQAFIAYFTGITNEVRQRERDEVLAADVAQIRSFAPMLDAVMAQDYFCAVGNEDKIEESDLFLQTKVLIH